MSEFIKAIETEYKGYRFRSRLEARWAVFFDAAHIQYDYEIEGYEIGDGERYLPDFYLPEFQIFVEIKPKGLTREEQNKALEKCSKLRTVSGKAILIKFGDPAEDIWGYFYGWDACDSGGGEYEESAQFINIGEWQKPNIVLMVFGCRMDRNVFINDHFEINEKVITEGMLIHYYPDMAMSLLNFPMSHLFNANDVDESFDGMRKKARQARFEYGEH